MISKTRTQLTEIIRLQSNFNRSQSKKTATNINNRQMHFVNEYESYYVKNKSKEKKIFLNIDHRKMRYKNSKKIKTEYRSMFSRSMTSYRSMFSHKSMISSRSMTMTHTRASLQRLISVVISFFRENDIIKFLSSKMLTRIDAFMSHSLSSIKNFYIELTVKSRKFLFHIFKLIKILVNSKSTLNFIVEKIVKNLNALFYNNSFMIMIIANDVRCFLSDYTRIEINTSEIFRVIQT